MNSRTTHSSGNGKLETFKDKAEDWAKSELNTVRKLGAKSIREAEDFAKDALDEAAADLSKLEKKATAFIRKNPYLVVGAALAIGFALAKLIRRPASHV